MHCQADEETVLACKNRCAFDPWLKLGHKKSSLDTLYCKRSHSNVHGLDDHVESIVISRILC